MPQVSSNIRTACMALARYRRGRTEGGRAEEEKQRVATGSLPMEAAEVARLCGLPDHEMLYESVAGRRTSASGHRRSQSDCSTPGFADLGPAYMGQRKHQYYYHIGQHYAHAEAWAIQAAKDRDNWEQQLAQAVPQRLAVQQQLVARAKEATCSAAALGAGGGPASGGGTAAAGSTAGLAVVGKL